jgi:hypothetical protein
MVQTLTTSTRTDENVFYSSLSTLIIVLFLFFIDEGYYSFTWMLDWGNWVVFVIYLLLFFPVQWILSRFLFAKAHGLQNGLCMLVIGIPLTLGLFFWLLM